MNLFPSYHWVAWMHGLKMNGQQGGKTYPRINRQGFN